MRAGARPRILHVFAVTSVGGTELGVLAYIDRQPDFKHHALFFERSGEGDALWAEAGRPAESLGLKLSGTWPLAAARRLANHLVRLRPDLVHVYGLRPSLLMRFRQRRPPLVHAVYSLDTHRPAWQAFLDRSTAGRVDRYIANSRAGARYLVEERGVRTERIRVVPNGIDVEAFAAAAERRGEARAALGLDPRTPVILTVANLRPPKGLDLLVETAARLAASSGRGEGSPGAPPFVWLIAGEGPLATALADDLDRHRLGGLVRLLGFRRDIPALLAAADLFCLTSRREGVPVAILEAMAVGRAVVATEVGGVNELVVDAETGRLVPADDPAALTSAIQSLLDDPVRRGKLAAAGQMRARSQHAIADSAAAIAAVYGELLGSRCG
jgi:glycosyltransferase involved in cell wall biosynthesis